MPAHLLFHFTCNLKQSCGICTGRNPDHQVKKIILTLKTPGGSYINR